MNQCIIIANGDLPKKSDINYLRKNGFDTLICADGGANSAYKLDLIPNIIIGDLDSIREEVKEYYASEQVPIKLIKRQNDTDVEKCIKYAIDNNCKRAVLLGATGDRLDHSFCNIGITLKYFDKIRIDILHQKSFLSAYNGTIVLATCKGETVSIYGVDSITKFSSKGLKYPLKLTQLAFGLKESTSNVAMGKEIELIIKQGPGLVIRDFKVMRDNGFLFKS